jgi:hypothetical protein
VERASPAEGYQSTHAEEQERIITDALSAPVRMTGARRVTAMAMRSQ